MKVLVVTHNGQVLPPRPEINETFELAQWPWRQYHVRSRPGKNESLRISRAAVKRHWFLFRNIHLWSN